MKGAHLFDGYAVVSLADYIEKNIIMSHNRGALLSWIWSIFRNANSYKHFLVFLCHEKWHALQIMAIIIKITFKMWKGFHENVISHASALESSKSFGI